MKNGDLDLTRVLVLRHLKPDDIASTISKAPGEFDGSVWDQGAPRNSAVLVLSGCIKVVGGGREHRHLGKDELAGYGGLLHSQDRDQLVPSRLGFHRHGLRVHKRAKLAFFDLKRLDALVKLNIDAVYDLAELYARRAESADDMKEPNKTRRLARFLSRQPGLVVPRTREELACEIGIAPRNYGSAEKTLGDLGLVRRSDGGLQILDHRRLHAIGYERAHLPPARAKKSGPFMPSGEHQR